MVRRSREITPPPNNLVTETKIQGVSEEDPPGSSRNARIMTQEPLRSVCIKAPSHHEVHSPSVTRLDGICAIGDPEENNPPKRRKIEVPYARVDPDKLRPCYSTSHAVKKEGRASASTIELLHSKFSPVNPKL